MLVQVAAILSSRTLAERYAEDRTAYTSGKAAFIREVLSRDAE
jgi:hypothetical protein